MTLSNKRTMRNDELFASLREFLTQMWVELDVPQVTEFNEADEVIEELERRLTAGGSLAK